MDQNIKKSTPIPGTKLSVNNTQLLISSGIPSFDDIVGGGLPVGTITLIEEDTCGSYSKLMLQYFLSEGVVCDHSAFIGSQELNISMLVASLPAVITADTEDVSVKSQTSNEDDLKIAWRYKNLSTSQNKPENRLGHFFDLSRIMDSSMLDKADIAYWQYSNYPGLNYGFANPAYHELLEAIKAKVDEERFSTKASNINKSILRIALQSIGSPLWMPNESITNFQDTSHKRDLNNFLYCLRAIVRSALASVLITIPSNILDPEIVDRCVHTSDIVVRLESFSGTQLENNRTLTDYQGFFHLVKIPAINTLAPLDPGPIDFAFKLRRKKFQIEELHLPPELQDSSEREQDDLISSMGCGSSNRHLLEF